jgi:hypothetical protein
MTSPRKIALTAAAWVPIALAGCAATHGSGTSVTSVTNPDLAHSATVLDQNARVLAAHSQDESPAYSADVNLLEQRAYDFQDSVQSGRADEVKADFNRLSQSYQAVRNDVAKLDTTEARTNLQPVAQAYQDVESRVQGHAGSSAPGD